MVLSSTRLFVVWLHIYRRCLNFLLSSTHFWFYIKKALLLGKFRAFFVLKSFSLSYMHTNTDQEFQVWGADLYNLNFGVRTLIISRFCYQLLVLHRDFSCFWRCDWPDSQDPALHADLDLSSCASWVSIYKFIPSLHLDDFLFGGFVGCEYSSICEASFWMCYNSLGVV